jgi:thioredoxin reductase (NADPH)
VVHGGSGKYIADVVVIATGAQAKWLGLPTEQEFQGFGVSGCATCDGFFFRGKEVMVIGGGNTAVEEALYLTNHASKVILVHRRDEFRAEKILQERLFKNPKIEVIWNHQLIEVKGTDSPKSVTHAVIKNTLDNTVTEKKIDGIFIAIGHKPNTDLFKGMIDIDEEGYIMTKPNSTKTNIEGVFAAGDVQDKIFRQAVTAAGTGCMAALEAEKFLA